MGSSTVKILMFGLNGFVCHACSVCYFSFINFFFSLPQGLVWPSLLSLRPLQWCLLLLSGLCCFSACCWLLDWAVCLELWKESSPHFMTWRLYLSEKRSWLVSHAGKYVCYAKELWCGTRLELYFDQRSSYSYRVKATFDVINYSLTIVEYYNLLDLTL